MPTQTTGSHKVGDHTNKNGEETAQTHAGDNNKNPVAGAAKEQQVAHNPVAGAAKEPSHDTGRDATQDLCSAGNFKKVGKGHVFDLEDLCMSESDSEDEFLFAW